MSRAYDDAQEERLERLRNKHVADQLGIDVTLFENYPYDLEEIESDEGVPYCWRIHWHYSPPPGVQANGQQGSYWNDVAIGHLEQDDEAGTSYAKPTMANWAERMQALDLYEVPQPLLDIWDKVPQEETINLRLPKSAIEMLVRAIQHSVLGQAELVKVSMALKSQNSDSIDSAMTSWGEQFAKSLDFVNRLETLILTAALIERGSPDER